MERCWRIELLGRFRARWGDYELSRFPRQKAGDLLAYLAYYPSRAASREARHVTKAAGRDRFHVSP